jgi:hypothetical protein
LICYDVTTRNAVFGRVGGENVVPHAVAGLFTYFRIFSDLFTPSGHEKFPAPQKLLYMVYEHASLGCSCLQLVALNCTKLQVVALRTCESKRFQHHKTPSTSCHLSSLRYLRLLRLKIRPPPLGSHPHSITPPLRLDPHRIYILCTSTCCLVAVRRA